MPMDDYDVEETDGLWSIGNKQKVPYTTDTILKNSKVYLLPKKQQESPNGTIP